MDVDIDTPSDFDPLDVFDTAIRASRVEKEKLVKHNVGVYFQNIPVDKTTGLAAIPYDKSYDEGYFKFDFLHLSILDYFDNKQQIRVLLKKDPEWILMQSPSVVARLFQLHQHFDLLIRVKPSSVQEIADCIALIRPSKRWMIDKYVGIKKDDRDPIRQLLYQKPDDGRAYFKRGHAISYALTIVLQLHLIQAGIINTQQGE